MLHASNSHRRFLTAALAAVAAATLSVSVQGAFAQSGQPIVLGSGTVIPVKLNSTLSSKTARDGDTFTASVDNSKKAYDDILHNATVEGVVDSASPKDGKTAGTLKLSFRSIHLADGRTVAISGSPTGLDSKAVKTDDNGVMKATSDQSKKDMTYAGIGAGVGALGSVLSNGKLNIGSALLGGAIGYGASQATKAQNVHDVELKEGTEIGVQLNDGIRYYHHEHPKSNGSQTDGKYYTYQGHPYYLDYKTGARKRLD